MAIKNKFTLFSNWKMNKTCHEGLDWIESLKRVESELSDRIEIIPGVPLTLLRVISKAVESSSRISISAQNVYWEKWGPFTGEISASMLADAGARYCVVGHSERRVYFAETDEMVNKKALSLLAAGIRPIICIGETIEEREKGLTCNKLERQMIICLEGLSEEEMKKTVILYEPIWAIGTGRNATPQQAQEAHRFIRDMLERIFSHQSARATRIVCGGSVKVSNVAELVSLKDIDGVGVGSGSWNVDEFIKIARICSSLIL